MDSWGWIAGWIAGGGQVWSSKVMTAEEMERKERITNLVKMEAKEKKRKGKIGDCCDMDGRWQAVAEIDIKIKICLWRMYS